MVQPAARDRAPRATAGAVGRRNSSGRGGQEQLDAFAGLVADAAEHHELFFDRAARFGGVGDANDVDWCVRKARRIGDDEKRRAVLLKRFQGGDAKQNCADGVCIYSIPP